MASDISISLTSVSKVFKRYHHPVDRLKEILLPGKQRAEEFWALQDITLTVEKGETVGIIGRNGSGKSTLLQIIAGTLRASSGTVYVGGRVSALLELGSGFNPEFTGEQNVFFNGRILGLSHNEIEQRFDKIVAFADIGEFINQPVKTYSSGMTVRLAFAVASHTDPDILIVDEALAVGDAQFQSKCMRHIKSMQSSGTTLLFVSHDPSSVKMLCKRALLLNKGILIASGKPKDVINQYTEMLTSENEEGATSCLVNSSREGFEEDNFSSQKESSLYRHGNKSVVIGDIRISDLDGREKNQFETGSIVKVSIELKVQANLPDLIVGFSLRNLLGLVVYGTNTKLIGHEISTVKSGAIIQTDFKFVCPLNQGIYNLTIAAQSEEGISYDWIEEVIVLEFFNSKVCDGLLDLEASAAIRYVEPVN